MIPLAPETYVNPEYLKLIRNSQVNKNRGSQGLYSSNTKPELKVTDRCSYYLTEVEWECAR